MITEAQFVALQTATIEQVLLTVLQGLVVVGFLGVSVLAAHLLVQAFRTENGEFRIRDARLMLAGAGVLFVTGFTSLVVTDGIPAGSLAGVALGFAGVTYLLYTARPELFARSGRDGTSASADRPIDQLPLSDRISPLSTDGSCLILARTPCGIRAPYSARPRKYIVY